MKPRRFSRWEPDRTRGKWRYVTIYALAITLPPMAGLAIGELLLWPSRHKLFVANAPFIVAILLALGFLFGLREWGRNSG